MNSAGRGCPGRGTGADGLLVPRYAPSSAGDDESTADATAGALEPCNTANDECPPGTECVPTGTTPGSRAGSCIATCDLAMNDCPEGEKCLAFGSSWQYQHCVPVAPDPAGAGEPCSWIGPWEDHVDTCAPDLICWYPQWRDPWASDHELGTGVCLEQCGYAVGDCPEGTLGWAPTMFTDMCACTPICDPLQMTCPSGSRCQFQTSAAGFGEGGEFVCEGTSAAQDQGGSCLGDWQCSDGLLCAAAVDVPGCEANACCTPFCDVQGPDTCPDPLAQDCIALTELWGDDPDPPGPEFAHIGACVVP